MALGQYWAWAVPAACTIMHQFKLQHATAPGLFYTVKQQTLLLVHIRADARGRHALAPMWWPPLLPCYHCCTACTAHICMLLSGS